MVLMEAFLSLLLASFYRVGANNHCYVYFMATSLEESCRVCMIKSKGGKGQNIPLTSIFFHIHRIIQNYVSLRLAPTYVNTKLLLNYVNYLENQIETVRKHFCHYLLSMYVVFFIDLMVMELTIKLYCNSTQFIENEESFSTPWKGTNVTTSHYE